MSQNPTYEPESGYSPYEERSGRSTPQQFYANQPAPAHNNMASYRQATNEYPPASDNTAGNGKSYRYATEAIPEDEDEADAVASSRQVQFESGPAMYNSKSRKMNDDGDSSAWDKHKFIIMLVLAIVFALLWVIFMGLYIQQVTASSDSGNPNAPKPVIGGTTDPSTIVEAKTTAAPVDTPTTPKLATGDVIGQHNGDVLRYTLTNKNGMELELLSLGARINTMKKGQMDTVLGFPTTMNASEIAKHKFGAVDGPICGSGDLYQVNFDSTGTTDGGVRFTTRVGGKVDVSVTYHLYDSNQVKVNITGVPVDNTETKVDMCSQMRFKLDSGATVTESHSIMIAGHRVLDAGSWIDIDGVHDYKTMKTTKRRIELEKNFPRKKLVRDPYELVGAPGLRLAARLKSSTVELAIQTNQEIATLRLNIDKDYSVEGKQTYRAHSSIGIITQGYSVTGDGGDDYRMLLKPGAVYNSVTVYTLT